MIDKLDQTVSPWVPLKGLYSEIYSELHRGKEVPWVRRGGNLYSWKVDLRAVPDDASKLNGFLYLGNRQNGGHKLELFDVGKSPFNRVFDDTEKIFDGDPLENSVSRMDLATDVSDVPPVWFRSHARVQYKQFGADFSEVTLQSAEMGRRKYETLYFGKRPNCIRIYDKTAELMQQYKAALRGLTKTDKALRKAAWLVFTGLTLTDEIADHLSMDGFDIDIEALSLSTLRDDKPMPESEAVRLPSFEEFATSHGFAGMTSNTVLTRLERQIGGSRFPEHFHTDQGNATLSTVWNRLRNGRQGELYDPFERLRFEGAGVQHVCPPIEDDFGARDYLVIRGLQVLVEEVGLQRARQMLNAKSPGNGGRLIEKYADYIPAMKQAGGGEIVNFSREFLFERFRESITKQLAA